MSKGFNAYFLRVHGPVTLNIEGKKTTIGHNRIVFGNYDYFIGFPGFRYLPNYVPDDRDSHRLPVATTHQPLPAPVPAVTEPPKAPFPNFKELDEMEDKALKSLQEIHIEPPVIDMKNSTDIENKPTNNIDLSVLDEFRKLSNKEWFSVDTNRVITALKKAGIPYEHLPEDRWQYIKLLKTVIKHNPN
jgi:hypothetical protein